MRTLLISSIKITLCTLGLFAGVYPACIWCIAQFTPNQGQGFVVHQAGKTYYTSIGQSFTDDRYFWSRPSAVGYNAAGSAGSNKAPYNPDYLAQVQARVDSFLVHNPGITRNQVPADLVTASGSGLDPHLSVAGARVQIPRIARARGIPAQTLEKLVEKHTITPLVGLFGPSCVNVLQLNLDLDNIAASK